MPEHRRRAPSSPVIGGVCTIVSAESGEVRYDWTPGDTATAGTFDGEFHVTLANSLEAPFPNNRYFTVVVAETLG